ncbi:DUF3365 domain-containing protein [Fontimonas sp. SYSU GA230001]|uniref:Tll0287-like domain-containing protein n=1 Tax=Fontimonas sp. SYSU GA230001 TaxID=3142450 RepID=UPI0032B4FC07
MRMVMFLWAAAVATPLAAADIPDPRLDWSRALADRFQSELKTRLTEAMAAGGPVRAIEVCKADAPAIAARLSAESGAGVGRTALRLRNPANAPDAAERAVLEEFAAQRQHAADAPAQEDFARAADGSARYMRVIVTQPPCLACHGATLADAVRSALAQQYPQDQATGFAVGDLRGAFVIRWPAATAQGDAHEQ